MKGNHFEPRRGRCPIKQTRRPPRPSQPASSISNPGEIRSVRGGDERKLMQPRNQNQFLAVGRSRRAEITILCLDGEAAQPEQMMELPPIGPAKRHLAHILREYLAVGPNFSIAPEIAANLGEVIETGSENLTPIAVPGL